MVIWLQSIFYQRVCDRESKSCGLASTVMGESFVYFGTSCVNCISDAGKRDFPVLM